MPSTESRACVPVTGHSDECCRSGTLDSAAGICSQATRWGLAAPSPGFPAQNFIWAETFERVLDMMAKLAEVYEASGNIADALRETENAGRLLAALETDPQIGAFARYRDDIAKSLARLKVL